MPDSGKKDQALAWLEKGLAQRVYRMVWLKANPMPDSLHSDQHFQDLMRRVGLPL